MDQDINKIKVFLVNFFKENLKQMNKVENPRSIKDLVEKFIKFLSTQDFITLVDAMKKNDKNTIMNLFDKSMSNSKTESIKKTNHTDYSFVISLPQPKKKKFISWLHESNIPHEIENNKIYVECTNYTEMKKTLIAFTIIKENIKKGKHSKKEITESIFGLNNVPPLNLNRLKELAGVECIGGPIDCKPDLNDKLEQIYKCDSSKYGNPYASIEADPYSEQEQVYDDLAHETTEPIDLVDTGSLSDAENEVPMFSNSGEYSDDYNKAMDCINQLHNIIMNMKVSEYRKIYDNLKSMFEHI